MNNTTKCDHCDNDWEFVVLMEEQNEHWFKSHSEKLCPKHRDEAVGVIEVWSKSEWEKDDI